MAPTSGSTTMGQEAPGDRTKSARRIGGRINHSYTTIQRTVGQSASHSIMRKAAPANAAEFMSAKSASVQTTENRIAHKCAEIIRARTREEAKVKQIKEAEEKGNVEKGVERRSINKHRKNCATTLTPAMQARKTGSVKSPPHNSVGQRLKDPFSECCMCSLGRRGRRQSSNF